VYPNAMIGTGLNEVRDARRGRRKEGEKDVNNEDAGFETVRFQGCGSRILLWIRILRVGRLC
jgi:hypothetical protein